MLYNTILWNRILRARKIVRWIWMAIIRSTVHGVTSRNQHQDLLKAIALSPTGGDFKELIGITIESYRHFSNTTTVASSHS